jgi:hypothetical protein
MDEIKKGSQEYLEKLQWDFYVAGVEIFCCENKISLSQLPDKERDALWFLANYLPKILTRIVELDLTKGK